MLLRGHPRTVSSTPIRHLHIGDQVVPVVPEGPQVILVFCLYLPRQVRNESLATTLEAYGKVIEVFSYLC